MNTDPSSVSLAQVLGFLQEGLDRGLSPNTIPRQVAALSSIWSCGNLESFTKHPTVCRFLRVATNLRPPVVHRYPTWDLTKVLHALTEGPFEPLRSPSLHFLVAFLVATMSARQISELAAFSVRKDLCIFHSDWMVLLLDPSYVPKVNSWFHRAQELILPDFCPGPKRALEKRWHTLHIRRDFRIYIKRTSPLRWTESLFVSFQHSTLGNKVAPSTMGRWIWACIAKSYEIQTSSASECDGPFHQKCSHDSGVGDTGLYRAVTWSSQSPFIRITSWMPLHRLKWPLAGQSSRGFTLMAGAGLGTRLLFIEQASFGKSHSWILSPEHSGEEALVLPDMLLLMELGERIQPHPDKQLVHSLGGAHVFTGHKPYHRYAFAELGGNQTREASPKRCQT
ncbi:uncharacterized protein LOC131200144 [Ahaetulla prasina]|uniref:uncharacterized protein LOC131200144 n=1 Tax=Ahaetulla prasina TaxID=499056 RepID=UPI0026472565|nr:uncharacterized protein LOC131200144 [Ahaetulla prasina]